MLFQDYKFKTKRDGYVNIHPSSVNFSAAHYENPYLVYAERIKTSRVFIRELSMVRRYIRNIIVLSVVNCGSYSGSHLPDGAVRRRRHHS